MTLGTVPLKLVLAALFAKGLAVAHATLASGCYCANNSPE